MKVGIIQSNYLPWRGYFDFIDDVDTFVFYDDVQYTKRDWRNRNMIKTIHGPQWIIVPVNYLYQEQLICDVTVDYSTNWIKSQHDKFYGSYKKAKYVDEVLPIFDDIQSNHFATISQLNTYLIKKIMKYLGIKTKLIFSSDLNPVGKKRTDC